MLSVGIEPQARDLSGRSALHYAARNCVSSIIYKLMNAGAEVDVQDIYGFTPLHYAAALKNDSVFKVSISYICHLIYDSIFTDNIAQPIVYGDSGI